VGSEDRFLRADLENIYAFTHKEWNPHVVENAVPANLEFVNRSPRLYVVLKDQKDTDQANVTTPVDSGKLAVSELCISPWIANVSLSMRVRTPDVRVFICACLYLHSQK
jgi:hypothetical protein